MSTSERPIRINVNAAIVRDDKILLIEFEDETGTHFNLPGGGVDPGESIEEALKRECLEEACVEIELDRMILVWEYVPDKVDNRYGRRQKIGLVFLCSLKEDSIPAFPETPDKDQTGVVWAKLGDLEKIPGAIRGPLYPAIEAKLLEAIRTGEGPTYIWSEVSEPRESKYRRRTVQA